jgi:Gpi18-like mannosyltransferase
MADNSLLLGAIALAVTVRWLFVPVILGSDFGGFLVPWYKATVAHGRVRSLGLEISDYTPPYMYLLAFVSWLPLGPALAIKLIPNVFDFLAAAAVYRLVRLFHPEGVLPGVAACCLLFCPTVLLNGALWAQSDIIYATFLLSALLGALRGRPLQSLLFFSVAFSVKLQALFFLPALASVFIARRYSLLHFALTPVAYLVFSLPPILLGRPIKSVLGVYLRQVGSSNALSLNAASVYQWLPVSSEPQAQIRGGLAFAAGACALVAYVILKLSRRPLRSESLLGVVLLLAALPPFLLPMMHERYAFMSDVLVCVVPFVIPTLTTPALLLLFASFVSYGPFIGANWMPLSYAAVMNVVALVLVARHVARDLGIVDVLAGTAAEASAPEQGQT